jgi:hypothetical protein
VSEGALLRRVLLDLAADVLAEETPGAAEALLTDEVAETLAEMLRVASPADGAPERA